MYSMGGEMLAHKEGEFYLVSDVESIIEENRILKEQVEMLHNSVKETKIFNQKMIAGQNKMQELLRNANPDY